MYRTRTGIPAIELTDPRRSFTEFRSFQFRRLVRTNEPNRENGHQFLTALIVDEVQAVAFEESKSVVAKLYSRKV